MQLMSYVLIEKNERYLLIKEASSKWCGEWFFPGGKVNPDETIGDAAVREVQEEAGCKASVNGIFYLRYYEHLLNGSLHIYFYGNTDDAHMKSYADENSLEVKWFPYSELCKLRLRQNAMEVINAYRNMKSEIPSAGFRLVHE